MNLDNDIWRMEHPKSLKKIVHKVTLQHRPTGIYVEFWFGAPDELPFQERLDATHKDLLSGVVH